MNTAWLDKLLRRLEPDDDYSAPVRLSDEAELLVSMRPSLDEESLWWETPYGQWRLRAEIEAMCRFPSFKPATTWRGEMRWTGRLASALSSDTYLVRVTYPFDFPDEPPKVFILAPELQEGVPHVLSPQRPCLYGRGGPRDGYDPGFTTAATLVAWTALWIHAYETWLKTGDWPGRGD